MVKRIYKFLTNGPLMLVTLLILTVGVMISFPTPISNEMFLAGDTSETSMLLLWNVGIYLFLKKHSNFKFSKYDWLGSFVLSFLYVSTEILSAGKIDQNVNGLIFSGIAYLRGGNALLTLICFVSWFILLAYTIRLVRFWFVNVKLQSSETVPNFGKLLTVLLLIWFVSMFVFLPGQVSWDALRQFCEFERTKIESLNFTYLPTNHQPWFTTLIFGGIFSIGRMINPNTGIFLVILFQALISGTIYTQAIRFVWRKLGSFPGILTFLMFASPLVSTYIITIDKSTLSYALGVEFLLIYIKCVDLSNRKAKTSWKYYVSLLLVSFLFAEFRNDSKYVVIISLISLTLWQLLQKVEIKKTIVTLLAFVLLVLGWNQYLNATRVISGASSEAITIPVRQLSYVYLHNSSNFTKTDKKIINRVTPINQLKKNYQLDQADALKDLFPVNTFLDHEWLIKDVKNGKIHLKATKNDKKNISNYLKLWLIEGTKHPIQYVAVYLGGNSRYFNPMFGVNGSDGSLFLNYFPQQPNFISPSWWSQVNPIFPENIRTIAKGILELTINFPLLSLLVNCGFSIWVLVSILAICLSERRYQILIVILPILAMIVAYTLTPVNGYSRYTLGVTAMLPVMVTYVKTEIKNKMEKSNG